MEKENNLKKRIKFVEIVDGGLKRLEKEGKLSRVDGIVKYNVGGGWDQLSFALGIYKGPIASLFLVNRISKPWHIPEFLTFGRDIKFDPHLGGKEQLESLLKPLEENELSQFDYIKNSYGSFPNAHKNSDILYQFKEDRSNLVIIRSCAEVNSSGLMNKDMFYYIQDYFKDI